ncbi:MAG: hypothetical protein LBR78_03065 [Holosporales bacterium]|nr:hypothetical protein [Holosporales bacterium]
MNMRILCLLSTAIAGTQVIAASEQNATVAGIDGVTPVETETVQPAASPADIQLPLIGGGQTEELTPAVPLLAEKQSTDIQPPSVGVLPPLTSQPLATIQTVPGAEPTAPRTPGRRNGTRVRAGAPRSRNTCAASLQKATTDRLPILNLSHATDINTNGLQSVNAFFATLDESHSYGTNSRSVYIGVAGTGLTMNCLTGILATIAEHDKDAILNVAYNENINDDSIGVMIQAFPSVVRLNLTGTRITDVGVTRLIEAVRSGSLPKLRAVVLNRTNTTPEKRNELHAAISERLQQVDNPDPAQLASEDAAETPLLDSPTAADVLGSDRRRRNEQGTIEQRTMMKRYRNGETNPLQEAQLDITAIEAVETPESQISS